MDTQTLLNPPLIYMPTDLAPIGQIQVCSRDYGFDFDEEEIACELLAPLPAGLSSWAVSQPDADELDFDALRFLS